MRDLADLETRSLERERSARPLLVGVLAVLLVALAVWWIRYDPVVTGTPVACPSGSVEVDAGDVGADDPGTVCAVTNRDATLIAVHAPVRNGGVVPVRIRDVRLRGEVAMVMVVEKVSMWPTNDASPTQAEPLVPFAPFGLGPGEERLLELTASLPACEEVTTGRVATLRQLPLRSSVLGLPRDSHVALDPPMRLLVEPC
jgi:hypothetical protein